MENQINRLGFEAWANNLIVNAIENIGDKTVDYTDENAQFFLSIKWKNGIAHCAVRVYVPSTGWEFHELEYKNK